MKKYTIVNDEQLDDKLEEAADAIRAKTGKTEKLDFLAGDFKTEIESIQDYLAVLANKQLTEYSSEEVSGSIAASAFSDQPNLVSVNLPNWTGGGSYAFQTCPKLTTVGCQGLQAVGSYCFSGCKSLERIELPSLTYLSQGAFNSCEKLTTVIIGTENSTNVATLQNANAFTKTPIESGTGFVYVRDILVDQYKTKWSAIASQIKPHSEIPSN